MTRTVAHYIDTSDFGGAEQALLHLMVGLDRRAWRSILLHPKEPGLDALLHRARAAGIETRVVPGMHGPSSAVHLPRFRRVVHEERPDVFHAHLNWPLACSGGILAAAAAGVPAIVATVQLFSDLPQAATIGVQRTLVTRAVDRYVAVSAHVAHRIETSLGVAGNRITVIHNGVLLEPHVTPPGVVEPAPAPMDGAHRPIVLTLARLDRQKGLDVLLHAVAELPQVTLVIAGEGPQREALESLADELKIAERVSFPGFRSDTRALLSVADLFVLPSHNEGLPLALIEAMAAARPVIASAIGGIDEVVSDGATGLLVPPGDATALAGAIKRLLDAPDFAQRLALAGRDRVERSFTAAAMVQHVARTYEGVLATTHRGRRGMVTDSRSFVVHGEPNRLMPLSREFGFDRGSPVDRHYIEAFLLRHSSDIQGRVLEVKDDTYSRRYGGTRLQVVDVLDIDSANPRATLIDDLTTGAELPASTFDCIVLTQTLHLIFDIHAAAETLQRILKPGGVLLLTVPGITQIPRAEAASWYWSFSDRAAERLFEGAFPGGEVEVTTHGNVLAATAFLYGVTSQELTNDELDHADPDYPVTITVRAVKSRETA